MLQIITSLLDMIFPPRQSELLVRSATSREVSKLYQRGVHAHVSFLSEYSHPLVHALVTENKYHENRTATRQLAVLIKEHATTTHSVVYIPIPLHKKREQERGYNQVTVILRAAAVVYDNTLITRLKHTDSQTTLTKEERAKNVKEAFFVNKKRLQNYTNTHFVLVDDVVTTGATMEAARAVLQPKLHPTSTLSCLAIAH
jgi:ComF family protein